MMYDAEEKKEDDDGEQKTGARWQVADNYCMGGTEGEGR